MKAVFALFFLLTSLSAFASFQISNYSSLDIQLFVSYENDSTAETKNYLLSPGTTFRMNSHSGMKNLFIKVLNYRREEVCSSSLDSRFQDIIVVDNYCQIR